MQRKHMLGVALSMPLTLVSVRAQQSVTYATLSGRVLDPAGALIAGAHITATQQQTAQRFTSVSDRSGRFRMPFLPPGSYRVMIEAAGFLTLLQTVELNAGSAFEIAWNLPVAGTATSMTVNATAPVLDASRSELAQTLQYTETEALPFSGRNFLDAALLTPGVSATNTSSVQTFAETSPVVGQGYSLNSQRNFSNSFVVDGLSANDDAAGLAGNAYSPDVVSEVQVITAGGQAEFGRALGGYVNIVTRSGGDALHGTAYGFLRNSRLNAQNPLAHTRLPMTQAEFGTSLSGPLRKERSFFFGNYEGRRLNTDGLVTIGPANATAINNRLDALHFGGPRLAVSNSGSTLYPTTVHTDTAFLRGDHRFGNGDQLSLRYSLYRLDATNARGAGALADVSYGTVVRDTNHTLALSNVAALSPRVYNETRAQFTSDNLQAPPNTEDSPAVVISGVASFGRFSSSPTARVNRLLEVVDNLVLERGEHTVKTGADFLGNDDTITFPQSIRGAYTFASLAAFQAGTYNTGGYTQNFGTPLVHQRNPNLGLYAQDEWKLSPTLTLNLGARYELEFLQTINTDTNNVSPRAGLAWSPGREHGTVIRASAGLFYDRVPLRALANALLSANNTTDPAQGRLLSYTYSPSTPGAPVFPNTASTPPATALLNYTLMNRNLSVAYSAIVDLGVEQQLTRSTTLEVTGTHVRGVHLLSSYNVNLRPDGSRPDPTRGNIKPYDGRFDSSFDGLEAALLQRPVRWGSTRISYTWSRATDNVGEFFFSAPLNNFNFSEDRGRSDDDQRHRLAFDALVHSPFAPAHGFVQDLLHGWQLSGILQYTSRLPFNIVTGGSTLQQTAARPCVAAFYGTLACAEALRGTALRRNAGTGFDYLILNPRVSRQFALGQRMRLEALAQAFNVLNHRNDAIPNGTFGSGRFGAPATNPSFGQATAVMDPRGIEFGARLSF